MQLDHFKILGEALVIGLLLGAERYRAAGKGQKKAAGVRTFATISILGAVASLVNNPLLTFGSFCALATLIAISYYRLSGTNVGMTTEAVALLTFWLGYLVGQFEVEIVSLSIVLTILLAGKEPLHVFVKETISEKEFYDALKFLAVVFVVYPLLPETLGPLTLLNPSKVWSLIILVSSISFLGYVLVRIWGPRTGIRLGAVIGGIVSTVAMTVLLAQRSREAPALSRFFAITGVLANGAQFPRLLLLIGIAHAPLAKELGLPLIVMMMASLAAAWTVSWKTNSKSLPPEPLKVTVPNPYSFTPALKFGLFFITILILSNLLTEYLGERGIIFVSLAGGLASVSAVALSAADLNAGGMIGSSTATLAILVAVLSNSVMKWILAGLNGTRRFALWLGAGLGVILMAGALSLALATYLLQ